MAAPTTIDVSSLIDQNRISSFQLNVLGLCTLCLLMDGFDLQALGYVAPAVVRDFKVPNAALGPVFGAANVGLLIGTVLVSMLADKIGRRWPTGWRTWPQSRPQQASRRRERSDWWTTEAA